MKNAKLKPLCLYDILKEKTDAQHPMSVPELTQELISRGVNAERKGVYRDIDALVQYGADIVQTSRGYYLRAREFDAVELKLLLNAVRAAPFISKKREAELMKKLAAFSGEHRAAELKQGAALWCEKASDDVPFRTMEIVGACIAASKQLTFLFGGSEDRRDTRRYRVNPYFLLSVSGETILVCNAEGERGLREFPLSRMSGARVEIAPRARLGDVSNYKAGLSAEEYFRRRPK
ncbi:MAG TPA: WYL domain-containing protein [Clostridia bacterium]|nr:WYL domain-containing protein [Clostridia bacterium]